MRIAVQHTESFTFDPPASGSIQVGRLSPRDHTGHYVCDWQVEVDADCKLTTQEDAFGNIVTSFSLSGPLEQLSIRAYGEIETEEHHGIVRGSRDDVPMGVFLRISHEGPAIALARTIDTLSPATEGVEALHTIMAILHESLPEDARLEPVDSPAAGEGQSQSQTSDVAEPDDEPALKRLASSLASAADTAEEPPADLAARAFCEAARLRGFPARLVSGYRLLGQDQAPVERRDVWAEAFVDQLGWIGFDCRTNSCPSSESVRAATGLDLPSISPLRFAHYGNGISPEQTTVIALTRVGG